MILIGFVKIAIGIIALTISVAVFRHRASVAKANANALTGFFGKLGAAPAKGSTTRWVGFVAIIGMAISAGFIIQGAFNLFS